MELAENAWTTSSHCVPTADWKRCRATRFPSPEAARNFLYEFHSEAHIESAKGQRSLGEIAYIPGENGALHGLGEVNRDLVREVGRRCPDQRIATIDQDATIIGSRKQEALRTCEGERGYQPMLAVWAEMNLVLADEFRDGNVPAAYQGVAVANACGKVSRGVRVNEKVKNVIFHARIQQDTAIDT